MVPSPSRTLSGLGVPNNPLHTPCRGGATRCTRGRVPSPFCCNGYYVLGGFHLAHCFFLFVKSVRSVIRVFQGYLCTWTRFYVIGRRAFKQILKKNFLR